MLDCWVLCKYVGMRDCGFVVGIVARCGRRWLDVVWICEEALLFGDFRYARAIEYNNSRIESAYGISHVQSPVTSKG